MNPNTLSNEEIMYGQYTVPEAEQFVKFGVGQPSTNMLPLNLIKKHGLEYIQSLTNKSVLQYGDIPGYKKFLQELGEYLTMKYERPVSSDELFISNGVTDALHLICSLFSSKNPLVVMEDPTYFLAKDIFKKDFQFDVISVPMESDGMNMNSLQSVLEFNKNRTILLYTIPTFHNPTSYTMSHKKRIRMGDIMKSYPNVTGIADEVYQLLYFEDNHKPPLPLCYYNDKFISLGSFSKILAPSLRMGWMQIKNTELMKLFIDSGKFDSSGGNTPFVQAIIHGILMSGQLDQNIVSCRQFLFNNCVILSDLINSKLGKYVEFVKPDGGYFLWLKLKAPLTALALLKEADAFKVHFHSGSRFSVSGGDNYIRLSFSYYDEEGMRIGVNRLEQLCMKVMNMMQMMPTIGILGRNGRLGTMVAAEINEVSSGMTNIIDVNTVPNIDILRKCSAILDVSKPDGTSALLDTLLKENLTIPLVIGTTGLNKSIEDKLKLYSKAAPVAYVSNFSKGIPVFIDFLDHINPNVWDIQMTETHHIHKVDKPSGTAKTLAYHIKGKDVPIESIRDGEVFGTHTVNCSTNNEELTVTHTAKTRNLFAVGAVEYLGWIIEQKPGLYYNNKSQIKFSKYSACGNDFIIVSSTDFDLLLNQKEGFIRKVCRRNLDVGADGVIEIGVEYDPDNLTPIITWTYYNCDGKTVEMCGNGARCVGRFAYDIGLVPSNARMIMLRNNFNITQKLVCDTVGRVQVEMPRPIPINDVPGTIYASDSFDGTSMLSVGVPHIVHKIDNSRTLEFLKDYPLCGFGKQSMQRIEANVNIYMACDSTNIYVRTYERGVNDETLACGSGCCAAAITEWSYSSLNKATEYKMHVASGDILTVSISDQGEIMLEGNVNKVCSGIIPLN